MTMGRDVVLNRLPSVPAAEQQTQGTAEVAAVAEPLEDRDLPFDTRHTLTFRVTGAASAARLEPLLLNHDQGDPRKMIWRPALSNGDSNGKSPATSATLDFVWETTVTKEQHLQHRNARVLNRLSGAQVRLSMCPFSCNSSRTEEDLRSAGANVSALNLVTEPYLRTLTSMAIYQPRGCNVAHDSGVR